MREPFFRPPLVHVQPGPVRPVSARLARLRPGRVLARPASARLLLAACVLCAGAGLGCGEEVLVGRWVLRSSPVDAGLEGDAGAPDNPQSVNAERARQREHDRDSVKPHDADKRH